MNRSDERRTLSVTRDVVAAVRLDDVNDHRVRRHGLTARHQEGDAHELAERGRCIGSQERATEADVVRDELYRFETAGDTRDDARGKTELASVLVSHRL